MRRKQKSYTRMAAHNVPWVESLYFEEILKTKQLSVEEVEMARFYNKNGYLILRNCIEHKLIDETRKELQEDEDLFSYKNPRAVQLWKKKEGVKKIATHPKVLKTLEMLYGREAIPFQTLNFKYGSRQKPHSDSIHFHSLPERFMCGVWVALEDISSQSGPVTYYPESHKLPVFDYQDISPEFRPASSLPGSFYYDQYEPFIQKAMDIHGFSPEKLIIKKGDLLIWSANIVHGGTAIENPDLTRWSQVNHYYFKDCLYYTPQNSNRVSGEYFLREITNIKTNRSTWGNYNGQKVRRKKGGYYKFLISPEASYDFKDVKALFAKAIHKIFK